MHLPNFVSPIPISAWRVFAYKSGKTALVAPCAPSPFRRSPMPRLVPCRTIISANSLEDSKRRAKSKYDNIPDLNQQYLAELNWIERKYGRDRLKSKNPVKEAQKSILYTPSGKRTATSSASSTETSATPQPDLSQYNQLRNQLVSNTIFLGAIGLCIAWSLGTIREVQSFGVGLFGSVAYVYLLSRSVDRLADAARETGQPTWDALQAARIAIMVLLVVGSARNADKLSVVPVLLGFFTHKIATLVPLLTGEAFE